MERRATGSRDLRPGVGMRVLNFGSINLHHVYAGANRALRPEFVTAVLDTFGPGDWLVLQNEVSGVAAIMEEGNRRGLTVVFNAAPFTPDVPGLPLHQVRYLVVNETESTALSGKADPEEAVTELLRRFPRTAVVLTLGRAGV